MADLRLYREVSDDRGLRFAPDTVAESLGAYDIIVVPGGFGTRALQHDKPFIQWLRSAAPVELKPLSAPERFFWFGRLSGRKTRDNAS